MTITRPRWTLLAVSLATFMTYLDNNIVNVAMPAIQRDLHLSTAGLEWVVSGYILVFASLLLAGGRLADVFGRRRVFLIGLGIFTVASLAAGLAGSVGFLIASRAVQGLGAALVTPPTLAIISATFTDKRQRAAAVGTWTAVGALALAVGPLIGGVISQHVHWSWIFYINVPVGIATIVLAAWAIRESREDAASRRIDLPGLLTSAGALFALTYALIEGHDLGWTSPGTFVPEFEETLDALADGVGQTWFVIERTLSYIGGVIVGKESADQLGGPIRIAQVASQVATTGFMPILNLAAILSVSIGLLNLFPIPMLDGGHLLFYLFEVVRGRPLSDRAQEYGFRVGLALVLLLMIFAISNDLNVWKWLS